MLCRVCRRTHAAQPKELAVALEHTGEKALAAIATQLIDTGRRRHTVER